MTSFSGPMQPPVTSSFPPDRTLPSLATGSVVAGPGGPSLGRGSLLTASPVTSGPAQAVSDASAPGQTPSSSSAQQLRPSGTDPRHAPRADGVPHGDHRVDPVDQAREPAPPSVEKDRSGAALLGGASLLLVGLASAQGYVSFRAQFAVVNGIKHETWASILEALGLDAAAVIFALLALALARLGRPALTERFLNVSCAAGSLLMNLLSARMTDPRSVAVWVLPAVLYAAASDRVIAVVRRRALARHHTGDERSAFTALATVAASVALWLLRLLLAFSSTFKRTRALILQTAPVAPGLPLQAPSPQDRTAPADRHAAEPSASADKTTGRPPADRSGAHTVVRLHTPISRRGNAASSSADVEAAAAHSDQTVSLPLGAGGAAAADGAGRTAESAGHGRQRDRARRLAPPNAAKAAAPAGEAPHVDPVRLAQVAEVAGRLQSAGVPVTREALRSEGVKGDNGLLGQLLRAWRAQADTAEEPTNV